MKLAPPTPKPLRDALFLADLPIPSNEFNTSNPPDQWEKVTDSHGTGTASHIVGFKIGTRFSTPLTAGVAALMLKKSHAPDQAQVESILKSTALWMNPNDGPAGVLSELDGMVDTISWDTICNGEPCDPVGAGLVQSDADLAAMP